MANILLNPRELQLFLEERLPKQWKFMTAILPLAGKVVFNSMSPGMLNSFIELNEFLGHLVTKENATNVCDTFQLLFNELRPGTNGQAKKILEQIGNSVRGTGDDSATIMAQIKNKIEESLGGILDNLSVIELIASALLVILQSRKLAKEWKTIQNAENIMQESRVLAAEATQNIATLEEMIVELIADMVHIGTNMGIDLGEFGEDFFAEAQRVGIQVNRQVSEVNQESIRKFQIELSRINRVFIRTETIIGHVQANINGQTVSLRGIKSNQVQNGLVNFTFLAINFAQYWFTSPAEKGLKLTYATFALIFGGLTVANVATYKLTEGKLQELRLMFEQFDQLNEALNEIGETVDVLHDWHNRMVNHRQ